MLQGNSEKRVVSGVFAHIYAQIVTILTQIISLPIFLTKWSLPEYGVWVTLSSVPIYLTLLDFGVLTHAGNSMVMHNAKGDKDALNKVFSSALRLLAILTPIIIGLVLVILKFSEYLFDLKHANTLILLSLTALIALNCQLFDASYRAFGKYPKVTVLLTTTRVIEWIVSLVFLMWIGTIESVALGLFLGRLSCALIIYVLSKKDIPDIKWSLKDSTNTDCKNLFNSGYGFMAFPVGNALSLQGVVIMIGWLLGPVYVAQFAAYRTLSRVITQMSLLTSKALSPEISALFGKGHLEKARALLIKTSKIVIPLTLLASLIMLYLGEKIIDLWSHGKIEYDFKIFLILVCSAFVSSIWQLITVGLVSTNNHSQLARMFMTTTLIMLVMIYVSGSITQPNLTVYTFILLVYEIVMLIAGAYLTKKILAKYKKTHIEV